MKYDKMVDISKEKSKKKVLIAKREIKRMQDMGEQIIVAKLVKITGFSSPFFYRNQEVRKALEDAIRWQEMCLKSGQVIEDDRLKRRLLELQIEMMKTKMENENLTIENQRLLEENKKLRQIKDHINEI